MPDQAIWALQTVKPDLYIGKDIVQEIFIVKNHPVGKMDKSKVEVRVFIYDGEVIGGTSYPARDDFAGWGYSLDGKSAEEVQGQNIQDWSEEWNKTYSN